MSNAAFYKKFRRKDFSSAPHCENSRVLDMRNF